MRVAIQVPVYDEPDRLLQQTLTQFRKASSERFDPTCQAWITPTGPSDSAFDVASGCGFTPHEAREGKLAARNDAHDRAFASGHDAIITIDADAPLLDMGTFDAVVRELQEGAVAVNGVSKARVDPEGEVSVAGALVDAACRLEDVSKPHISGRFSALSREAWEHAGPFDESVDQTRRSEVREVEEFGFYQTVSEVGDVVYAHDAVVYNDLRRHICTLPLVGGSERCRRFEGDVSFAPAGARD